MNIATVGAVLMLLAATGLLVAYNSDRVPFSGPYFPPSREDNPDLFDIFTMVLWGLGFFGLLLVLLRLSGIA